MYPRKIKLLLAVVTYFLLALQTVARAEDADRSQPINLEADQVMLDDVHQTGTFTGNVKLTQGTLLIRGDRIVVEQGRDGFKKATAYGKTAEFSQKQSRSNTYAEGFGERIEYDTRTQVLDIYGQARLKRNRDEVSGEHIVYNTQTEIFSVNGSSATGGESPQRVRAILHPREKNPPTPSSGTQHE